MATCDGCGNGVGMFSGRECDAEDCGKKYCSDCAEKKMATCDECGEEFCPEHIKNHGCENATDDASDDAWQNLTVQVSDDKSILVIDPTSDLTDEDAAQEFSNALAEAFKDGYEPLNLPTLEQNCIVLRRTRPELPSEEKPGAKQ